MLQHHSFREISTTVSSKLYAPNPNLISQTPLTIFNVYNNLIFHCLSVFQITFGLFITYDHSFRLSNLYSNRTFMASIVPQGVHKTVSQLQLRRRNLFNNQILSKVKVRSTNLQTPTFGKLRAGLTVHKFFLNYRESFYANSFTLFTPRKRVNLHRHFMLNSTKWLKGRKVPLKRQLRIRRNAKYRKKLTLAKISWFCTLAQLTPHIAVNPLLGSKFKKFERRFLQFNRRSVKRVRTKTFFPRQDLFLNLRRGHQTTLNKQTFFRRSALRVIRRFKRKLFRTKTTFRRDGRPQTLRLVRFLKIVKRRRQSNFTTRVLKLAKSRSEVRVSQPLNISSTKAARAHAKKKTPLNRYRYVERGIRRVRFQRRLSNYGSVNTTYNSPFRWRSRLSRHVRKRRPRRVVFSQPQRQLNNLMKTVANRHSIRSGDTNSTLWLANGLQSTLAQSLVQSQSALFRKGVLKKARRSPFLTIGATRAHKRYNRFRLRYLASKSNNRKPKSMLRPRRSKLLIKFRFRTNSFNGVKVSRRKAAKAPKRLSFNFTRLRHTTTATLATNFTHPRKATLKPSISRDKLILNSLFTHVGGSEELVCATHFHQYVSHFRPVPRRLRRRHFNRLIGRSWTKRVKRRVRNRRLRQRRHSDNFGTRLFKRPRRKAGSIRSVRRSDTRLSQNSLMRFRMIYRSKQTIITSTHEALSQLDSSIHETELVSKVPRCSDIKDLDISSTGTAELHNVQLNLVNRTRFITLMSFKSSSLVVHNRDAWKPTLASFVRRATRDLVTYKRINNRRYRTLHHPTLVSPNKTNFIASSVGFLFLQADTLYRNRLNKQRLNKHRYSFFYSNDLKRTLLRSKRSYVSSLWSKRSKSLSASKAFTSSPLDTSIATNSNALLILSSTQKALLNRTPLKYMRRGDLFYRRDVRLRRIKFKPGYSRIWRRARTSIKVSLNINARYQHKLTRHLVRMTRLANNSQVFLKELAVRNVLLNSSFVFDNVAATTLLDNHLVYLNGLLITNPNLSLFKGDLLQLVVNLKYYILFKWLRNWNRFKRLRLARLAYSKFRKSRNSQHKQRSQNFPDWILATRVKRRDIPNYLEVDFFTLSAFVIYEPFTGSDFQTKNLLEDRTEILNMYNWKYIN